MLVELVIQRITAIQQEEAAAIARPPSSRSKSRKVVSDGKS
jgi:hypothetical protein